MAKRVQMGDDPHVRGRGQKTSTKAETGRIHRNSDAPLSKKRAVFSDVVIRLIHRMRLVGRRVVTAAVPSSLSSSLKVLAVTVVVEVDEHVVTL